METKYVSFEIKDTKDNGSFTGYASTFGNEDLGGDIIMQGAFAKTIKENPNPPVLWGHSSKEVIGINQSFSEDSKGLYVEAMLNMDVQRGREAHSLMKMGAVKGLSIGYDAVPAGIDWSREKEGIRILREIKLYEYSATPFPMNPEATVLGVKSMKKLDELLHQTILMTKRNPTLSAETKALMEQTVLALQAAKALEAASQEDLAPDFVHAGSKCESIYKILRGEI